MFSVASMNFLSPSTGTFHCTFCQTEVEEDESVCPDARTLVARFNEQIEPIYVLLRETEDVNLSHDLLEPEPAEIPALKERCFVGSGADHGGVASLHSLVSKCRVWMLSVLQPGTSRSVFSQCRRPTP